MSEYDSIIANERSESAQESREGGCKVYRHSQALTKAFTNDDQIGRNER